jgi:hypothetical protein
MRTPLYVRLRDPRHALLLEYARKHDFTLNEVIERLVDQLLLQVAPGFRAPRWLIEAITEGHVRLELPDQADRDDEDDEDEPIDNVLKWSEARHRP